MSEAWERGDDPHQAEVHEPLTEFDGPIGVTPDGPERCDVWMEVNDEEGWCTRPLGHEGIHSLRTRLSNPPYEVLE